MVDRPTPKSFENFEEEMLQNVCSKNVIFWFYCKIIKSYWPMPPNHVVFLLQISICIFMLILSQVRIIKGLRVPHRDINRVLQGYKIGKTRVNFFKINVM